MQWSLRCELGVGGVIGHILIWVIVVVLTCGIAFFLFPYSFAETLVNATKVTDANGQVIGRLRCTTGAAGHVGHAILWWFLTIITLGIAGFFYMYDVGSKILSATVIEQT
jgi:hypothetical protein